MGDLLQQTARLGLTQTAGFLLGHKSPLALVGRQEECIRLDRFLDGVRAGEGAALVLRGEPGVGKSSLLDYAARAAASDFSIVRATGVEGEADLPYSSLHQLCLPFRSEIAELPPPQREALGVAFGLQGGAVPQRYHAALAVLSLLSEAAGDRPLLCVIDDAQWLDQPTTQALAFVGRRLFADRVALLVAVREPHDVLGGLEKLRVSGLTDSDARALLGSLIVGSTDAGLHERVLAEAHGNPLALVEFAKAFTRAEAAVGHRPTGGVSTRIEESYRRRADLLPPATRRLLLVAAAEPLGDFDLLTRAAERLEIPLESFDAATAEGLVEANARVVFCHPLARAAVYRGAAADERRAAHAALAAVTDMERDPDRYAWHRAQASLGPDETVAAELELTAERARARGGVAASAAFLGESVRLTPVSGPRAERAVLAAERMLDAAVYDDADRSAHFALGELQASDLVRGRAERVSALVRIRRDGDPDKGVPELLLAARHLLPVDPARAKRTLLEASSAANQPSEEDLRRPVLETAAECESHWETTAADLCLRGYRELLEEGFPAGIPMMVEAMRAFRDQPVITEEEYALLLPAFHSVAYAIFDFESLDSMTDRLVQVARDWGALWRLPQALELRAMALVTFGRLSEASALLQEAHTVDEVTGAAEDIDWNGSYAWGADDERILAGRAWPDVTDWVTLDSLATLYNGQGRYDRAEEAAERASAAHRSGAPYTSIMPELIEASQRVGNTQRAVEVLELLKPRTRFAGGDWALGVEAYLSALLEHGESAERLYREGIERLARTPVRTALGRAHLLYGEWLRREKRRGDAREQLRCAYELFSEIGAVAFTERARSELVATGENVRKRHAATDLDLTPQELRIAQLAGEARPIRRLPPGCTSAPGLSSITCARCTRSSASRRVESSAAR
jgi:tetratricopeptide (TPR) repeat protein